MDRRDFLRLLGVGSIGAVGAYALPQLWEDQPSGEARAAGIVIPDDPKIQNKTVLVVGGGMAGAACAKYLKLWGGRGLTVKLIEKEAVYTSNIMSNMAVIGEAPYPTLADLQFGYAILEGYGIQRVQGVAESVGPDDVDATRLKVTMANGATAQVGDAVVLAAGLQFPGKGEWFTKADTSGFVNYDPDLTPHAWQAGPQTVTLHDQLHQLPVDTAHQVVITIPLAPYRCPPGPYERACVIADWLRQNRPLTTLTVLDENAAIQAEPANFQNAFAGVTTKYQVQYISGVTIDGIDSGSGLYDDKSVTYTKSGTTTTLTPRVLNAIPPMQAPAIVHPYCPQTGTTRKFAPVNPLSFETTHPGTNSNVYVIGDSASAGVPKAGHIGNQEGKTAAAAIVRRLRGDAAESEVILNSACYTPITIAEGTLSPTATWLSAVYQATAASPTLTAQPGQPKWAPGPTAQHFTNMLVWFRTVMADTFG